MWLWILFPEIVEHVLGDYERLQKVAIGGIIFIVLLVVLCLHFGW